MNFALITGASKGIGKSLAFALAKRKTNLLLVARSGDLLEEISISIKKQYSVEVDFLSIDLSHQDSSKFIYQWCLDKGYSVNILINNAGYGLWGEFDKLGLTEQNNMMQLNMFALVNLTYEMLPLLKLNNQAYILNVSSTTAYQAIPTLSLYAASKAFVLLFSRGLKLELEKSNVKVSCICPGPTSTGFIERAGMGGGIMEERAEKFSMTSDKVAEIALTGMYAGNAEIIPGIANKVGAMFTFFAPKWLTEKITASLYKI
jgi:short-subunit dehydrogenase